MMSASTHRHAGWVGPDPEQPTGSSDSLPSRIPDRRQHFLAEDILSPKPAPADNSPLLFRGPARRTKSAHELRQPSEPRPWETPPADVHLQTSLSLAIAATRKIGSQAEYEEWAAWADELLVRECNATQQAYIDNLGLMLSHLDLLEQHSSAALGEIRGLTRSFGVVEEQTTKFRQKSEDYFSEHSRLTLLADEISENVRFYLCLEPISKKLNSPNAGDRVGDADFIETLQLLDESLAYMEAHPEQRDAHSYSTRYKQLLTRALILIRTKFTNTLREIAVDVTNRMSTSQLNDATLSTLLYAKFRVRAPEMKRIGLEIQKRALPTGDSPASSIEKEHQGLLSELFQSYTSARARLVLPLISKKLSEMMLAPSINKDIYTVTVNTTDYLRGICVDEHELWSEWFGDDGSLNEFLRLLCQPLYDQVKPRIARETKILKLCETCTFLQMTYFNPSYEYEDGAEELYGELDFGLFVEPLLHDVQARLLFLALQVLRNDIEYFKPTDDDLDYPARLKGPAVEGQSGPVLSGTKTTDVYIEDEEDLSTGPDGKSNSETWYPTLRRAVWLLRRIYRLVNSNIFDDLARQILHQTTKSFLRASAQISERSSPVDASLFMIQHLLILKESIAMFDLESGVHPLPEVEFDFSGLTSTFQGTDWMSMPGKLVRAIYRGDFTKFIPLVVPDYRSARDEVDDVLRSSIGKFVEEYGKRMCGNVLEGATLDSLTKRAGLAFDTPIMAKLDSHPMVANTNVLTKGSMPIALCGSILSAVPGLHEKLNEYLMDQRTKEMLSAAVMEQVVVLYNNAWKSGLEASEGHTFAGSGRDQKGKERIVRIWNPETLSDWCDDVFEVGRRDGVLLTEEGRPSHARSPGEVPGEVSQRSR